MNFGQTNLKLVIIIFIKSFILFCINLYFLQLGIFYNLAPLTVYIIAFTYTCNLYRWMVVCVANSPFHGLLF